MQTDQTRIAVIGCGHWGVNLIRVLSEMPSASVQAICDHSAERLADLAARFHVTTVTTCLGDLLSGGLVDAVIVSTPAASHYDIAKECLMANKHVLIEKPMTLRSEHAEELVALASRRRKVLMVGHTFVFNYAVWQMKEHLAESTAQPLYLSARRTHSGPLRSDVNVIWDLATHDFTIFNTLLESNPQWVSAIGVDVLGNGREDVAFISVGYPGGVVGHIHVSWVDLKKQREVTCVCRDRWIVFDDLDPCNRIKVVLENRGMPHGGGSGLKKRDLRASLGMFSGDSREPLRVECQHFIDCVFGGGEPLTSGLQGLLVVRALEAVELSLRRDGAKVEVVCS